MFWISWGLIPNGVEVGGFTSGGSDWVGVESPCKTRDAMKSFTRMCRHQGNGRTLQGHDAPVVTIRCLTDHPNTKTKVRMRTSLLGKCSRSVNSLLPRRKVDPKVRVDQGRSTPAAPSTHLVNVVHAGRLLRRAGSGESWPRRGQQASPGRAHHERRAARAPRPGRRPADGRHHAGAPGRGRRHPRGEHHPRRQHPHRRRHHRHHACNTGNTWSMLMFQRGFHVGTKARCASRTRSNCCSFLRDCSQCQAAPKNEVLFYSFGPFHTHTQPHTHTHTNTPTRNVAM